MLEFIGSKQTVFLVLTNIIMLLVMRQMMKPAFKSPYVVSNNARRLTLVICFIFCLFSFWGADWFGYIQEYELVKMYGDLHTNLEPFYIWLIQTLPDGYMFFRIAVWGSTLFILYRTIRLLPISFDLALLIFCSSWIALISYARASLAMAIMFYGIALYYSKGGFKGIWTKIIGVALVLSAIYFHKSAAFGVVALLMAIFSKNIGRRMMVIYICMFPLLVYIAHVYMGNFMSADMDRSAEGMESFAAVGQNYLSAESKSHGIGTNIQLLLEHIPFYCLAYLCYSIMQKPIYKDIPDSIKIFMKSLFFIILMSSVFIFNIGVNTDVVYGRFLRFSIIPSIVVLTYFYQNNMFPKWSPRLAQLAFISILYSLIYVSYTVYVKS